MSGHLTLPLVYIGPEGPDGRGFKVHCDQNLYHEYAMRFMEWCKLRGRGERDASYEQFSLFQPVMVNGEDRYWLLARGKYFDRTNIGHDANMAGVLLTQDDLDRIGWQPHRLLEFLPKNEPGLSWKNMSRPVGNLEVPLDKLMPPIIAGNVEMHGDAQGQRWLGAANKNQHAVPSKLHWMTPAEHMIAVNTECFSLASRPTSWSTTSEKVLINNRNIDWIIHPSEQAPLDPKEFLGHRSIYAAIENKPEEPSRGR